MADFLKLVGFIFLVSLFVNFILKYSVVCYNAADDTHVCVNAKHHVAVAMAGDDEYLCCWRGRD